MHKLTVTLRRVAFFEEATIEAVESTTGGEDLVFLVGPRAASFAVERASQVRTVLQKLSTGR